MPGMNFYGWNDPATSADKAEKPALLSIPTTKIEDQKKLVSVRISEFELSALKNVKTSS